MPRVKRGRAHIKRRRNILKRAKGFRFGRKNLLKLAKTAVIHAGVHAYRGRRLKKRTARRLWQTQLAAATKGQGFSYSKFMGALRKANIELNRKILAELANREPEIFKKIIEGVKKDLL